jgi:hypothetical protein
VLRRPAPVAAARFQVPARRDHDLPRGTRAVLFGVGWGLAGYCPGPALVSLASGAGGVWLFVAAMVAGMALERARHARRDGR